MKRIFNFILSFLSNWFLSIVSIVLLFIGVSSFAEADVLRDAGESFNAFFCYIDGYGFFILAILMFLTDCFCNLFCIFRKFSGKEPDKNKNENKE